MGAGSNSLFHQPHHASSSALQQQNQQIKNLRRLTTTAAAATAGLAGMHLYRTGKLPLPLLPPRQQSAAGQPLLQIPRELAEVICGAVGEIVQVAVLYPLDTIKVGFQGPAAYALVCMNAGLCSRHTCSPIQALWSGTGSSN